MHDPDAPGGDSLHWLVWDIPPRTVALSVNDVPVGAVQGRNSAGKSSYMGPCPPKGTGVHRYMFDFYALDTTLDLPAGSTREQVEQAMRGHIIDNTSLIGIFAAID